MQKSFNVLLCLAAVGGIGWSGTEIWQVVGARHRIDAACAGLVPPGRVLALSPAGGTITHRAADEGTIQTDGLTSGQDCELFSSEAGEKYGTDGGERWFFTGAVGVLPGANDVIADDPLEELLDPYGGPTYPFQPLGGGIAGLVGDTGVVVRLPRPGGKVGTERIQGLWARAELMDPGRPFTVRGQLSDSDRNVLAETAVITANRLAARVGCAQRLPDAPDDVPALPEGPVAAARADGTCAWYAASGLARDSRYPDQVLESRTDAKLWDEQCGLLLSDGRARSLYAAHASEHESLIDPGRPGQYFASLHTYSGPDATKVQLSSPGHDEAPDPATPGKAGRSNDEPVWWASSVCHGRPQIHTMTLGYGYDRLMAPRLAKVFRAYVADVTARRGCTKVTFPSATAFRES
ncbi:hypothetical protein J3486_39785 [Streptomyces sp. VRA16 Mangrove soil]|nr:hypothetical protein [Streptomyces sp. VRA16 Mangrove soil]